ncbi:MAG: hypothetical protein K2N88_00800, partial [Muribaculaceae bacterium]|nr:hypothetical protein [Muribaculaceae bacterium]
MKESKPLPSDSLSGNNDDEVALEFSEADGESPGVESTDSTVVIAPDTISGKTLLSRIDRSKVDLESAVTFSASDSLVLHGLNNAQLFGNGTVEY